MPHVGPPSGFLPSALPHPFVGVLLPLSQALDYTVRLLSQPKINRRKSAPATGFIQSLVNIPARDLAIGLAVPDAGVTREPRSEWADQEPAQRGPFPFTSTGPPLPVRARPHGPLHSYPMNMLYKEGCTKSSVPVFRRPWRHISKEQSKMWVDHKKEERTCSYFKFILICF